MFKKHYFLAATLTFGVVGTLPAHAGSDGIYFKADKAYSCSVLGGDSVMRYRSSTGSFLERWKRAKDTEPWEAYIGQWKLQKIQTGDDLLVLSQTQRYLIQRDQWPACDCNHNEIVAAGRKKDGSDFESKNENTRETVMTCSEKPDMDATLRATLEDLQARAKAAGERVAKRKEEGRQATQQADQSRASRIANLKKELAPVLDQLTYKVRRPDGSSSEQCRQGGGIWNTMNERLNQAMTYFSKGVQSESPTATEVTVAYYSNALTFARSGLGMGQQFCR